MKKLIVFALLFFIPVPCAADEFTFAWDYPESITIDGFRMYSGPMGQDEDGNWYPKLNETPMIDNIPAADREAVGVESGWPGQSKKFCFVARAFRGDEESLDSEMVCAMINNLPLPAPGDLSGQYVDERKEVELTWTQTEIDRAKFWQVYYRLAADTEFKLLDKVENIGQTDITMARPFDSVLDGQIADVVFAVVAYKDFEVYSPNSNEVTITIDRSNDGELPAPTGMRFKLTVQVE